MDIEKFFKSVQDEAKKKYRENAYKYRQSLGKNANMGRKKSK